jgi:hypothetical protein
MPPNGRIYIGGLGQIIQEAAELATRPGAENEFLLEIYHT